MRLEGKLAVITAAASGMGRAGVELFCREGARVCAVDLNQAGLDDLAEAMKAEGTHESSLEVMRACEVRGRGVDGTTQHSFQGSFSAVSTQILSGKYSLKSG